MRQALSSLAVVISIAFVGAPIAHAAPLLRGFGGPAGYGSGILPGNDDGSSAAIDLTPAFPDGLRFFGGPYSRFFVNNNGNITFNAVVSAFTPTRFPVSTNPMIAPYWADVDTRGRTGLADDSENLVYWHLEPGRLIVTWHNVGYYSSHNDLRMDFQLIITNTLDCGSGDFDVEFRYNRCEWTTGDASDGENGFGGTPAQAGFDAGNMVDFVEMPGSFTMAVLDVCTTSNIGQPGVWQFSVRSGGVVCPDAGAPCTIPDAVGPCAEGRTQCIGREVVCQPIGSASAERCDGVDNDCDGSIDDPDVDVEICTADNYVCSQGTCVPPCFEGGCSEGFTCDESEVCIETTCVGVTCLAEERCLGGECVAVCEGITCPHGQRCLSGRCTDPCESVTCDAAQTCRDGICIPSCPCLPCGSGETCGADGRCRPGGCDIVTCPSGFYCADGACIDGCEGVVCPTGQRCELQQCVDITTPPPPDAGMKGLDAGPVEEQDAGTSGEFDAGMTEGEPDAGRGPPPVDEGCACRVTPRASTPGWLWALPLALGLIVARRRRR